MDDNDFSDASLFRAARVSFHVCRTMADMDNGLSTLVKKSKEQLAEFEDEEKADLEQCLSRVERTIRVSAGLQILVFPTAIPMIGHWIQTGLPFLGLFVSLFLMTGYIIISPIFQLSARATGLLLAPIRFLESPLGPPWMAMLRTPTASDTRFIGFIVSTVGFAIALGIPIYILYKAA